MISTALGGYVASVTMERVAAVHAHIAEAVVRTSEHSTLPEAEQDRLLAQGCAEACDLLSDWLASPWWEGIRPAGDGPLADYVPAQEKFIELLGPALKDALVRAGRCGVTVPAAVVDQARAAVAATVKRHRRMKRQELFRVAEDRVSALRREICSLARDLAASTRDAAASAAKRHRARAALKRLSGLLLAVTLAMAGAGPHQMTQDLSQWGHEAVKVLMIHHIADQARPNLRIAPPRPGLRLH